MADDQLEWVFDSLVEFLRGPIWNIPVLTFIEQKSVVFEPGAENEEELKKIHEAYKNLVDFMLGSYMEDLRISPEEFEKSCAVASKKALNQFHQSLFQQVWAADDFEIFKRMMTQKNLELQLQALEFLTQKRGSVPDCMEPANKVEEEKGMVEIIKKVIEESEPEADLVTATDTALQEKMKQEAEKEKELLEQAMKQTVRACSPVDSQEERLSATEDETETPQTEVNEEPECDILTDDVRHRSEPESSPDRADEVNGEKVNPLPIEEHNLKAESKQCTENIEKMKLENRAYESNSPKTLPPLRAPEERPWSEGNENVYSHVQVEINPLELERRQNYLRQQRDRILAMKKQERARRLSTSEEVTAQTRPKSARAARKVLREENTDVDPQTLAFRKTLAAKLRSEVVDKED